MSPSRFVVLKLKDIIKTALLIVVALALIITVTVCLSKTLLAESIYSPGTYTSVIYFGEEEVTVSVTVDRTSLKNIEVSEPSETVAVFYPLLSSSSENVCKSVLEAQSTDVELSSANPVTDGIILDAIKECILQAEK